MKMPRPLGIWPEGGAPGRREDTRPTLGVTVEDAAQEGRLWEPQPDLLGRIGSLGNLAEAGLARDRWFRSRRDAHPPKMATPGETLPRGQPC